jgi:hypothetical protein
MELALAKPSSLAMVGVSGSIQSCLDITDRGTVRRYSEIMSRWEMPNELERWWRRLGYSTEELHRRLRLDAWTEDLFVAQWRSEPTLFDELSSSQIFGRLARAAGIEAIKYPSVRTNKACLAVFPDNFAHSDSYIELDGEAPASEPPVIRRLDRQTWRDLA